MFLFNLFVIKIEISSSWEDSSMLTSYILGVDGNYNSLSDLIVSLGPIPCFYFDTWILYKRGLFIEKLKFLTVVDQEMVAINDQQTTIYMHFLDELSQTSFY